jgi:hypothetical protein
MVSVNPRRLAALVLVAIGALYFAGSAAAATTPFGCRASAMAVRNSPLPAVEPFVANKALTPCATDSAGVSSGSVVGPNTTGGTVSAGPGNVSTFSSASADTSAGPVAPAATALAVLKGGSIANATNSITIVGPAQAQASYVCQNGTVVPAASSTLSAVEVNGTMVTTPTPGAEQTFPLPGGSSMTINEKLQTGNSLTERLIDLHLAGAGDIVLGEAQVTQTAADPCAGTAGLTPPSVNACPAGSTLNPAGTECVIVLPGAGNGGGAGAGSGSGG